MVQCGDVVPLSRVNFILAVLGRCLRHIPAFELSHGFSRLPIDMTCLGNSAMLFSSLPNASVLFLSVSVVRAPPFLSQSLP